MRRGLWRQRVNPAVPEWDAHASHPPSGAGGGKDGETGASGLTQRLAATIDPPSEPGASCRPVPILIVELSPWPAVVS